MPLECEEKQEILFDDIKAFVTHTPKKRQTMHIRPKDVYKERSSGAFEIDIKDEKLNALVRSIRQIIKEQKERNES